MTGLEPGVGYVLYIDQLRAGVQHAARAAARPEEYWNDAGSGDASKDDACAYIGDHGGCGRRDPRPTIAMNGIPVRPDVHADPVRVLPVAASDDGSKIAGLYGPTNESPYWVWDQQSFARPATSRSSAAAASTSPCRVTATWSAAPSPARPSRPAGVSWCRSARRCGPSATAGRPSPATPRLAGLRHLPFVRLRPVVRRPTAVGLAFKDCTAYAYRWTAKTGLQLLVKNSFDRGPRQRGLRTAGSSSGWQDEPAVPVPDRLDLDGGNKQIDPASRAAAPSTTEGLGRRGHGDQRMGQRRRSASTRVRT